MTRAQVEATPVRLATAADVAAAAQLACLLEVSAPKPGNVSPGRHFADTRYEDFLASAAAIGGPLADAGTRSVGATVRLAIESTRRWTNSNTNLGIVLLLTPLARAALSSNDRPYRESRAPSAEARGGVQRNAPPGGPAPGPRCDDGRRRARRLRRYSVGISRWPGTGRLAGRRKRAGCDAARSHAVGVASRRDRTRVRYSVRGNVRDRSTRARTGAPGWPSLGRRRRRDVSQCAGVES